MIISHRYRFIFIKTRKTAGTSIEIYLSQFAGPQDVFTPIHPPVPGHEPRNYRGWWNLLREWPLHETWEQRWGMIQQWIHRQKFYNHIPAALVRTRIAPDIWEHYFKFCVERNPWDKTLSHYAMIRARAGGQLSFDAYLANGFFCTDFDKYTDAAGNLLVDEVLRYETLNQDLARVFQRLGIPFSGDLGVRAKSEYRQDRRPYQEHYTPRQRAIIEQAFAREIAMFDYKFDQG